MLMPINDRNPFDGYKDAAATTKKIARDVFTPGDAYFRTGDLLSHDSDGFYYFVDRIGDTFRWKGENCSTTELAEVVSVFAGVAECNAYGVSVPENGDGRAPMVAITPVAGDLARIDLHALAQHVKRELPSYAVPMFLRILPASVATTATFKHQKVALRKEGIDVAAIPDPLFWMNPETGAYEPFGTTELHRVVSKQARL